MNEMVCRMPLAAAYLKQKARTNTLSLFEQNLTVSAFYEDMRCFSSSKRYSEKNSYVAFKYPQTDDVCVKRMQKAGITNTQELIAAVEQYDNAGYKHNDIRAGTASSGSAIGRMEGKPGTVWFFAGSSRRILQSSY